MFEGVRFLFSDKAVSFDTFVKAVALELHALQDTPELISQRKAWEKFGRKNVERWRNNHLATPIPKGKKILLYKVSELTRLQLNAD